MNVFCALSRQLNQKEMQHARNHRHYPEIVPWILGLVSSYTMGGLIHALLVIAIVVILIRVLQGRRI